MGNSPAGADEDRFARMSRNSKKTRVGYFSKTCIPPNVYRPKTSVTRSNPTFFKI